MRGSGMKWHRNKGCGMKGHEKGQWSEWRGIRELWNEWEYVESHEVRGHDKGCWNVWCGRTGCGRKRHDKVHGNEE